MTRLEQLEEDLRVSLLTQRQLREQLHCGLKSLGEIERLIRVMATDINDLNHYVDCLKVENSQLKAASESWMNRAIKLEFEVLSARDATPK